MSLFWATVSLRGEDISTTHKLLYLQKSGVKARRLAQIYKEKKKKDPNTSNATGQIKKKKSKLFTVYVAPMKIVIFLLLNLKRVLPNTGLA